MHDHQQTQQTSVLTMMDQAAARARVQAVAMRLSMLKSASDPTVDGDCPGCRFITRIMDAEKAYTNAMIAIADQFEAELREVAP